MRYIVPDFPSPRRNTGSISCRAFGVVCALALVLWLPGCAPRMDRYQWDMSAAPGSVSMADLRARRLVIRGMSEAQVRVAWGSPQEQTEMPPNYMSLTWKTREGWITVVFNRGRVTRVEPLIPTADEESSDDTSQRRSASQ